MATFGPKPRDSASEYQAIYGNPELRFDAGIKNARSEKRAPSPSEGRRKRTVPRLYQGRQETPELDNVPKSSPETFRDQSYNNTLRKSRNESLSKIKTATTVKNKNYTSPKAGARGISFAFTTMSWLTPVYFFWIIPISMISTIMLGLSIEVEKSAILSTIDSAIKNFGSLFGYEYVDLTAIGLIGVITSAFFGVLTICIAAFTAILWRLRPLSGRAAGMKKMTFILGIVGSCIPFVNMFPWVIFWVLVMMRHPK